MRPLLWKGIALSLAVGLSCGGIVALLPPTDNTFFEVIEDKWRRADALDSPKLLIVGGSNTAFGIDSRRVERELAIPVVNMGVNAGFGLRYFLNEASMFLDSGDVVVLSPEYNQFYGRTMYGGRPLLELLRIHPGAARHALSLPQALELSRALPAYFQDRVRQLYLRRHQTAEQRAWEHPVYRREAFNEYGDVESHLDREPPEPVTAMTFLNELEAGDDAIRTGAIRELRRFAELARSRGARVFILLPTIPRFHYERVREHVVRVEEALRERTEIPVLGGADRHVAPDDRFYDTPYHLGARGRAERTARLIERLGAELRDPARAYP